MTPDGARAYLELCHGLGKPATVLYRPSCGHTEKGRITGSAAPGYSCATGRRRGPSRPMRPTWNRWRAAPDGLRREAWPRVACPLA